MVASWAKQTVIRIRPGVKILRGSTVPDWDHPNRLNINDCSVQPAATTLSQDGRVQGISDGMTAFLPIGADVKAGDRIEFDGNVYTIIGDPRVWVSPTGSRSNIQLNLERWAG